MAAAAILGSAGCYGRDCSSLVVLSNFDVSIRDLYLIDERNTGRSISVFDGVSNAKTHLVQ